MKTPKLWSGRFAGTVDELVDRVNASIDFDRRLYREDIRGSVAHVRMLARQGIIGASERDQLVDGLGQVLREIESGELAFQQKLEDIHTHVEVRLHEICGSVAGKLHTARSRNDQVALDSRLYTKRATLDLADELTTLVEALLTLAETHCDTVMPGYTHLQRAQPVSVAHHLHAYVEMFQRDLGRFADAFERMDRMPLGAGALAGTTHPIERRSVAAELRFASVTANSIDSVASRDYALELMSAAAICGAHLSRLAEEIVLWVSQEFAFAELDDSVCTGSSMMPQKKNPDLAELVRGKAGRLGGNFLALFVTLKGLPLAYNKDLQEDKEPLFDTVDHLGMCLQSMTLMLQHLRFRPERLRQALVQGFLGATDLADYLVARGVPFREAHEVIGTLVRTCIAEGLTLEELPLERFRALSPAFEASLFDALDPAQMLAARTVEGGPAPVRVAKALELSRAQLAARVSELTSWRATRLASLASFE
ncbi:MAG: argininosuccinate lyase [Myxococcales bacterium]|nr:argininosuccinate lyase [Myxococcales bacterium]